MNNQISYAPKAREDLLEIKSFIEEEARIVMGWQGIELLLDEFYLYNYS